MEQKLPDIFNYLDFRKYLADYQRARYATDREFSRVKLCRRLGLPNSRSYFTDIVNGKKLTAAFTERLLSVLELHADEARYFRLLVNYNQAETADEQELYFEQLMPRHTRAATVLGHDAVAYYQEWYYSAVRAVLDVFDFGDEYLAVAKTVQPPITARQVKEALRLLVRLGLIAKNEQGFYKPKPGTISTGLYAPDEMIRRYQMQLLTIARDILTRKGRGRRSITTKLISVSSNGYERIDRRCKTFMTEISAIIQNDTDPADRVYHLDMQFFPGSLPRKGASE